MGADRMKLPPLRTRLRTADGKPLPPGRYVVEIADVLPSIGPGGVGKTAVLDVVAELPPHSTPVPPMRTLAADKDPSEETP